MRSFKKKGHTSLQLFPSHKTVIWGPLTSPYSALMFYPLIKDRHITSHNLPPLLFLVGWRQNNQVTQAWWWQTNFLAVDCDPVVCLCAGGKRTITPHIYREQTDVQPKTINLIVCMAKPIWPLILWEKTCDAHEPLKGTWGSLFISGSNERNASRSVSTCVTKHACLWLTGWKRLSRMAPFHSDTQLRPNWFEVHNRHVARQHPRLLCTCSLFSDSPLWKYSFDLWTTKVGFKPRGW